MSCCASTPRPPPRCGRVSVPPEADRRGKQRRIAHGALHGVRRAGNVQAFGHVVQKRHRRKPWQFAARSRGAVRAAGGASRRRDPSGEGHGVTCYAGSWASPPAHLNCAARRHEGRAVRASPPAPRRAQTCGRGRPRSQAVRACGATAPRGYCPQGAVGRCDLSIESKEYAGRQREAVRIACERRKAEREYEQANDCDNAERAAGERRRASSDRRASPPRAPADPRNAPQRRPGTVECEPMTADAPPALACNGAARGHAQRMAHSYRRVRVAPNRSRRHERSAAGEGAATARIGPWTKAARRFAARDRTVQARAAGPSRRIFEAPDRTQR